jgi:hypothetical protein
MEKDSWCYYSDLPSPIAYIEDTDYDGMGNHHRFPKTKKKKKSFYLLIKKLFHKVNKHKRHE